MRANHGIQKLPLLYYRFVVKKARRGHTPAGGILNKTTVCAPLLNYLCPTASSTTVFALSNARFNLTLFYNVPYTPFQKFWVFGCHQTPILTNLNVS